MRNVYGNLWVPDDGYKYLSNGEVYTDSIYLGTQDSIDNWHDTNDEPPAEDESVTPEEMAAELEALL